MAPLLNEALMERTSASSSLEEALVRSITHGSVVGHTHTHTHTHDQAAAQPPRPTGGAASAARATTGRDPAAERHFQRRFDRSQSKFTYRSWRTGETVDAKDKANVSCPFSLSVSTDN
eukprot:COSAG01_NODE_10680_length_2106_cov_2.446437_2_plen_118_part_00